MLGFIVPVKKRDALVGIQIVERQCCRHPITFAKINNTKINISNLVHTFPTAKIQKKYSISINPNKKNQNKTLQGVDIGLIVVLPRHLAADVQHLIGQRHLRTTAICQLLMLILHCHDYFSFLSIEQSVIYIVQNSISFPIAKIQNKFKSPTKTFNSSP